MSPWYVLARDDNGDETDTAQRAYGPGSAERKGLVEALTQMEKELPFEVPCIVNGKEVRFVIPALLPPVSERSSSLRSGLASSRSSLCPRTMRNTSARTTKRTRRRSPLLSMAHSPRRQNGKPSPGTIVPPSSSRRRTS